MKIEESDLAGFPLWDQFSEKLTALADAGFTEIVIDFGAVRRISSLALGTLVSTHQKMASAGNTLIVVNIGEELKRYVKDTKLLGLIRVD